MNYSSIKNCKNPNVSGLEVQLNTLMIDNNELIQKYRTKEMNKQRMIDLLKQLNMLIDAGAKSGITIKTKFPLI